MIMDGIDGCAEDGWMDGFLRCEGEIWKTEMEKGQVGESWRWCR